jgi:broad specificity phosphatase PhoE
MPRNLVIVRHGQSVGNQAINAYKKGDLSVLADQQFIEQHSSRWMLTETGRKQAAAVGHFIKQRVTEQFDFYYTSEYSRAMQTAGLLGISDSQWRIVPWLRERYRGQLDRLPSLEQEKEFQELFQKEIVDKKVSPYYWRPPGGESLVDVCARVRLWLDTLHRECSGKDVIVVCHGEVIEALRIELERMVEHDYVEMRKLNDPVNKIENGQLIHYTRQTTPTSGIPGPHETVALDNYLTHKRDIKLIEDNQQWKVEVGQFQPITRSLYSPQQLLDIAENDRTS